MTRTLTTAQHSFLATLPDCPIARIEVQRKFSPMAQLVRHTNQVPAFI